jgi:hypothetical protein
LFALLLLWLLLLLPSVWMLVLLLISLPQSWLHSTLPLGQTGVATVSPIR